jgi:hydroxyacylglutathione hydrolase
MHIRQLYTNCLAQGAYYIANSGEAAIIDPLRETGPYLELLKANDDKLKYIFETHFHADFVSGHVDLARETGAKIVFGPNAKTSYESHVARDNEEFRIGRLTLKAIHTPGHTLESTCYLLFDENKKPLCVFTGDTLFIGDVGRPDLAIKSDLTQEDLAGMLYDSLRKKILPLPDDIIVYPAHGAGSACGKNMSKQTSDTLGNQKRENYALRDISREQFVRELTEDILPAPQYFAKNAALNMGGYENYNDIISKGSKPLDVARFSDAMRREGAVVLDVRTPAEFGEAHIPGSLFIGLDGQFAPWVGTLVADLHTPFLLVTPPGREQETVMRLSRVGYDNCQGYLAGGIAAWKAAAKDTASVKSIDAGEFVSAYRKGAETLDVRRPSEFEAAHMKNADSKPLDFIGSWLPNIDRHVPYMVHCAGGYRSMIAISILRSNGFHAVTDVKGGFSAISQVAEAKRDIVSEKDPVKG